MIEEYLAILLTEHPELEGESLDIIKQKLKEYFNVDFTTKQIADVYQLSNQFETINEDGGEEDFFDDF